jgi:hypothetical protein
MFENPDDNEISEIVLKDAEVVNKLLKDKSVQKDIQRYINGIQKIISKSKDIKKNQQLLANVSILKLALFTFDLISKIEDKKIALKELIKLKNLFDSLSLEFSFLL